MFKRLACILMNIMNTNLMLIGNEDGKILQNRGFFGTRSVPGEKSQGNLFHQFSKPRKNFEIPLRSTSPTTLFIFTKNALFSAFDKKYICLNKKLTKKMECQHYKHIKTPKGRAL